MYKDIQIIGFFYSLLPMICFMCYVLCGFILYLLYVLCGVVITPKVSPQIKPRPIPLPLKDKGQVIHYLLTNISIMTFKEIMAKYQVWLPSSNGAVLRGWKNKANQLKNPGKAEIQVSGKLAGFDIALEFVRANAKVQGKISESGWLNIDDNLQNVEKNSLTIDDIFAEEVEDVEEVEFE